jgi:translation elongation factor EF-4
LIPRQLLKVPIPASVGIKGTAAKSISPLRKDLLAKCLYGGNISRKKNLVNKQSKGKKCTNCWKGQRTTQSIHGGVKVG